MTNDLALETMTLSKVPSNSSAPSVHPPVPHSVGLRPGSVRSATTRTDPLEAHEMAQVEQRLIAELSPAIRPEEVQRCVRDVIARFAAATIRTYVSLLVERIARDELKLALDDDDSGRVRRVVLG
jgi:hypothetical protein